MVALVVTAAALAAPASLVLELPSGRLLVVEWVVTAVLVADVVVRLRRPRHVREGAGSWDWLSGTPAGFVVDVVAAIPVAALLGTGSVWELVRLVKLLRVADR